jgi:hypothetical protein
MKIAIAGGRDINFKHYTYFRSEVDKVINHLKAEGYTNLEIVHGDFTIVENMAGQYAIDNKLKKKFFKINYRNFIIDQNIKTDVRGRKYNLNAIDYKNKKVFDYTKEDKDGGAIIAFYNGHSQGMGSWIKQAKKYGFRMFIIDYKDNIKEIA